jgi:hypothetical protein
VGPLGQSWVVASEAEEDGLLFDTLDSMDAAELWVGVVGGLCDFLAVVAILLVLDSDDGGAEFLCWVCEVISELGAASTKEAEVIYQGLINGLCRVLCSGEILKVLWSFLACPFAAAISHMYADDAPVYVGMFF